VDGLTFLECARYRPGRISLSGKVIEPDQCRSHERSEQKEFGSKDTRRDHQRLRGPATEVCRRRHPRGMDRYRDEQQPGRRFDRASHDDCEGVPFVHHAKLRR
jgi:hypothetical protein